MTDDEPRSCVLVVEDEAPIRYLVATSLRQEGYQVAEAGDAAAAAAHFEHRQPDLVLLDLNLPGVGGLEVLARIRETSSVPVIVLSGRADEDDRVGALRAGADDYITKPFSLPEFLARIDALLRRSTGPRRDGTTTHLRSEEMDIDLAARKVVVAGREVGLTAREFDLLAFLAATPREAFTRDQLLEQVWGSSAAWQDSATVTEHVRRIRRKTETDPDEPRYIQTVRGIGYRFTS